MRILYLTNKPIFPLLDGGCIAMNQTAKLLSDERFKVQNISIETNKHPFNQEKFPQDFITKFKPQTVFIDTKVKILGLIKSLLSGKSYHLSRFYSKQFDNALMDTLNTNGYDIIICESLYLLPYLKTIRGNFQGKVVLRTHNVEHLIWERVAKNSSFFKRKLIQYLAKQLKKEEILLLNEVDCVLSISSVDSTTFKSLGVTTKTITLPVFIDESTAKVDSESNHFYHMGAMNWRPNRDAVDELIKVIFPKIRESIPTAELHLAGSYFPNSIKTEEEDGIFVHGFVKNKFEFINAHGIQLVNLKSGSGVRIKLLESLSIGVPTVATRIGIEGLDKSCKEAIMISESNDEFVKNAILLYRDKDKRKSLGLNGIAFTEKHHHLSTIKKSFFDVLEHLS